ncbi:MAG: GNAT family N-acetyltransferase [Candidatus Dormibacteraeota bacterium]|uniref:GNAT family N-acetyltransferase n=1 Tax=Candidatus Dormiibacter inghamiae TaxID=3127013 RepID=A0A934NHR3_9BACT|nr:GNAT family N-acetyltransferase [Candidatus Dormibacteraeota bacterium]MBJ7606281.1 GNAT family N-acetyltransferase [Candidatus Dormibacteraeota bacterium]
MGDAGSRYEREVRLRDVTRVHVRPIRPDDEPLLQDAVAHMSERSVYFRFFSPLKRLPEAMARKLARVDYKDRFALVAYCRQGGQERIVGVARYDRAAGTDAAEVAVAVVDEVQRQGLGSQLLSLLAQVAREHGLKTFTLIVLPENQSMLALLRKLGWIHRAVFRGGLYEISFEI